MHFILIGVQYKHCLRVCVLAYTGRKVEKTVDLLNGEEEPFHFSVLQSSLLCEDQQSSLILQPMTGTVAPKDRLMKLMILLSCNKI